MPNLLTLFLTQIWPSSWPTFDPFLTHFFLRKIDFAMKRLFHVKIFHIISIHWKPIYYRLSPFGGFEPLLSIVIISLIFNENLQLALFALYAVYTLFEPFSQLSVPTTRFTIPFGRLIYTISKSCISCLHSIHYCCLPIKLVFLPFAKWIWINRLYQPWDIVSNYSTGDHRLSFFYAKLARRPEHKVSLRYWDIFSWQPSQNQRFWYSTRICPNYFAYLSFALLPHLLEKFEIPMLSCC